MINPYEIKLGNYVDTPEGIHQITGIIPTSNGIKIAIHSGNSYVPSLCHAIALNEKRLIAMGFKEGALIIGLGSINGYLSAANKGTSVAYRDQTGTTLSRYYQYVHEVQNFFHFLTGNELQISLDDLL